MGRDVVLKAIWSRLEQGSDLLESSRRFALGVMGAEDIWIPYKIPWDSSCWARRNRWRRSHPRNNSTVIVSSFISKAAVNRMRRNLMHAWKSDTGTPLLVSFTPRYGNSRITVFQRLFAPNGNGTEINGSAVSTCFWTNVRHLSDQIGGMVSLRCHRSKFIWATLGVLALLWLYIFPVYRIPSDKEMVDEVLRQGQTWSRNQTGVDLYRYLSAFWFDAFNYSFIVSAFMVRMATYLR